jgi:dihydroorotase
MTDLLIKGGTVVDPSQGLHERLDVAVNAGEIVEIGPNLAEAGVTSVVDATGKIVTPGLIDIHVHVYRGDNHRDPDEISGVRAGVTSIVDAGGAAYGDIDRFNEVILPQAKTRIYNFLGVFNRQAASWEQIDVDGIPDARSRFPDQVKGIKVHVMPVVTRIHHLAALQAAKEAGRKAGLPVMLHIGDIGIRELPASSTELTSTALDMLDSGDIVTHLYSPLSGSATDEDLNVLPSIKAAQARGVWLDCSMGDYQFGWETAEAITAQGVRPDTIASDIEIHSTMARKQEPMVSERRITGVRLASERTLLEYLANFFELGFSLDEIIRRVTETPAKVLGIEATAGSLRPGMPADISVLDVVDGTYLLTDVTGESRLGRHAIVPVVTFKDGVAFEPGYGGHPWGFEPPTATDEQAQALAISRS